MWLIPTSEVTLVNLIRDQIIDQDILPLRYTSYSPCFRSEAGAAGKDTRGLKRQHQFGKVEIVSIVASENSNDEHLFLLSAAEKILQEASAVAEQQSGDRFPSIPNEVSQASQSRFM